MQVLMLPFEGIVPFRLPGTCQVRRSLFRLPQQTLVYQRFQGVSLKFTRRSAHLPGCLECAATREDSQPSEQLLLLGPQELVAPSNCPTQCLLSCRKITR